LALLACFAEPAHADPIRIATYNTELGRKGPGLLLRDIRRGDDQVKAVLQVLVQADADILALQSIDWDHRGQTLGALVEALSAQGLSYPYSLSLRPNAGMRIAGTDPPQDHSFGRFAGSEGMALLSKFPIDRAQVRDYAKLAWRALPWTHPPAGTHLYQRLSTMGHWVVPILTPDGPLSLMVFHATPPVFDGPEDANGLRNGDEILFWQHLLDGDYGPPPERFVIIGDFNNDPDGGEGLKAPLNALLTDPRLRPAQATGAQGTATVDWSGIGLPPMRVSYILPDNGITVPASGILWPPPDDPTFAIIDSASRHRLVWADIELPRNTQENVTQPVKQQLRFLDPLRASR
jgi:endonuclease/exonuclease/phosphatase family metal-dependent hydrolase